MNRPINYSTRFRILKGGKISLVISALIGSFNITYASPSGGVITSGKATITQNANVTNIKQSSQKASINWQDFNIAKNEIVNFNQPNVNSITLNRVVGNEKSVINGALNANGQVWILNSNGVLFGKNASINTSGILATTAKLSDEDFNKSNYSFNDANKNTIINQGTIEVKNSGSIVLASNEVINEGKIKAVKGSVQLIGASDYSINLSGNSLVNLRVQKGVLDAMVKNSGSIINDAGEIYLSTNAVNELLRGVVNNTGIIEANSLDDISSHVELFAHGGEAQISGSISAKEGFVETSGKKVKLDNSFKVKANKWLIDPLNLIVDDSTVYETALNNGTNTQIQTNNTSGSEEGNIYINDAITWNSAAKLTLNAYNDIFINQEITAQHANGQVALHYGQGSLNTGNTSKYHVNAKVNLKAGDNFFTKKGSDGSETTWKVITALGAQGSTTGTDLQGIDGNLSGNYVLGANIDASSTYSWNSGKGFSMIGYPFTGKLDGLGHSIDALYINRPTIDGSGSYNGFRVGMFFNLQNAEIKNLKMTNVDITGVQDVGALAGYVDDSVLENIHISGNLTATQTTPINAVQVGGIAALMKGTTLKDSSFNGTLNGANTVGGLVGKAEESSQLINSSSQGTLKVTHTGGSNFGGLVGVLKEASIKDSHSTMKIEAGTTNELIGGLVGQIFISGTISDSYSQAQIDGGAIIGGLVGFTSTTDGTIKIGTITDSYFDGQITASGNSIGGLIGQANNMEINDSYAKATLNGNNSMGGLLGSTGTVNDYGSSIVNSYFEGTITAASFNIGGLIGYSTKLAIDKSHSKAIISGVSTVGGLLGFANASTLNDIRINESYFDGKITASGDHIGGLVGYTIFTDIDDSYAKLTTISGDDKIGGLVGYAKDTTIDDSYAISTTITGDDFIGGLMGDTLDTNINNSYAQTTTITANDDYVGGLVGHAKESTINNSYVKSTTINANDDFVGGLVGYVYTTNISNSYADTIVTGDDYVGGLVGILRTGEINSSYSLGKARGDKYVAGLVGSGSSFANNIIINNSYTEVDVTANEYSGGFIGWSRTASGYSTSISNSYANGEVDVSTTSRGHGFIGLHQSGTVLNINNSFWNTTKSGYSNNKSGSVGLSEIQMQNKQNFLTNSWDSSIWSFDARDASVQGYEIRRPYLKNVTEEIHKPSITTVFNSGNGTASNPYTINNWANLQNINFNNDILTNGYYFALSNDLGTSTTGYTTYASAWNALGNSSNRFKGNFDGQNHTISSFSIDNSSTNYQGLFGSVDTGSVIKDLNLRDVDIIGSSYVGALVGVNRGTIINTSSSGIVKGNSSVGGLAGYNLGVIDNSYSTVKVSANSTGVGGLVGNNYNNAVIKNSYSNGFVTGTSFTGGLVGTNYNGTIENSYSLSTVNGTSYVGGLVAFNNDNSLISNSYSASTVTGNTEVGGLVGRNADSSIIQNSYAVGSVKADTYLGGLVGVNNLGVIKDSYSKSIISGTSNVGGLIGLNKGVITNSYASTKLSGTTDVGGLVGKNTGTITNSYYDNEENSATTMQDRLEYGKSKEELASLARTNWDIEIDPTIEGGLPFLSWEEGSKVSMKKWLVGKAPVRVNEIIQDLITPIVNQNIVAIKPVNTNLVNKINIKAENKIVKVSVTPSKKANKLVTLKELQENSVGEVRVPVGDDSIITIVNSGVNLPSGIEQQYFVVAEEN